jgi:hypothetical protein
MRSHGTAAPPMAATQLLQLLLLAAAMLLAALPRAQANCHIADIWCG